MNYVMSVMPRRPYAGWTEEQTERLKQLWGSYSASRCAQMLGQEFNVKKTRNAVIGKATRMGLAGAQGVIVKTKGGGAKPRKQRARPVVMFIAATTPAALARKARNEARAARQVEELAMAELLTSEPDKLPANAVASRDREDDQCAWPVGGAGATMMCCGNHVKPRQGVYCPGHSRMGHHQHKL